MQYKTIVLELIQERPMLHKKLVSNISLLSTVNHYAPLLRDNHLAIIEELRQNRPKATDLQLASEAIEIALAQLEELLPPEQQEASETETFSLDGAMEYLRQHPLPG